MKQLNNGLTALYFYDLPAVVNEGESIASIIQKAKAIVDARKENAIPLQQAKENTLSGLENLHSFLEKVMLNIADYVEDQVLVNKITEESDRILQNIPLFKKTAEVLCSRLGEGKIRIVSIGEKSQGKSLFTQIFTGLHPESKILKVKAHNDTRDCTGAVNTFYHKDGQNRPLIRVEFLTVTDIVENIKSAIGLIQDEIHNPNWTLKGVESICDKSGLKLFLTNTNHQAEITSLVINPEIKSSLGQYFGNEEETSFVDLLGRPSIPVPESDVDEYNDMQHSSRHYLAVKRINITLDLFREGLFQYFEVADTKGLSAEAGAVANQNIIYDVINESDAVFSISRTGQQQNWKFYNQALGDHYRNNAVFKNKHFAIINVEEGFPMASADAGTKFLDDQKLSNFCYIGRLFEDSETDSTDLSIPKSDNGENYCTPKSFVDNLIIHMLGKIANHITEIDNERIRICQQSGNIISESLSKLKELLGNISYTQFDEEKLVTEKVRGFCDAALKFIEEQKTEIRKEREKDSDNEESDYELYHRYVTDKTSENRFASVYEVLTGEQYPGKLPQVDNDDEDKEIEKAVSYLFQSEKVTTRIAKNLNNQIHVGEYADELVWAIRAVILDPLFEREKQHPIACKKKEEIFTHLWELFSLDQISGKCDSWDVNYVDDKIREMRVLNDVYKKGVFSPFEKSDELMTPYSFLKEYFRLLSLPQNNDDDEEDYIEKKQNLDNTLCLKAIENEIARLSIKEKIINRIKHFPDSIESYCNNVINAIGNFDGDIAKYGCQFYLDNIEVIASDTDKERLQKSRRWDEVSTSIYGIMQYKFDNLPLISISE